jgi:hypothetical protein
VSFGIGRISLINQVAKYIPILATPLPSPSPNPWRQAAFTGILRKQGDKFYLVADEPQAISLDVPSSVNLDKYLGRKILATGLYDPTSLVLRVIEASDLELITGSEPVPTVVPTATPTPLPPSTIEPSPLGDEGSRPQNN